jgi:hypothetical protein
MQNKRGKNGMTVVNDKLKNKSKAMVECFEYVPGWTEEMNETSESR